MEEEAEDAEQQLDAQTHTIPTEHILPHFSIIKEHSATQHQKQSAEISPLLTNNLELFPQLSQMTLKNL